MIKNIKNFLIKLDKFIIDVVIYIGDISIFIYEILKNLFSKPFYFKEFINSMENIGYRSIPIVVTVTFFSGMIITLNIGKSMDAIVKGTSQYIGSGILLVMLKEFGPVLTSLSLISRVGAGITAQISMMKATEQIDALEVMSISPIKLLVIPNVLAMIIMAPLLSSIGVVSGIIGGLVMVVTYLDQSPNTYIDKVLMVLKANDIIDMIIKSSILGFFIAVVSSYYGMKSEGGARGVGIYTTRSVVASFVFIVIVDYLVTSLLITIRKLLS